MNHNLHIVEGCILINLHTHTHTYSETVTKTKITNIFFMPEVSFCSIRFHFSPDQEIPWSFFSLSISQNFLLLLFSCCVWLFVTPWTAAHQASLSFTISWRFLELMSIESVMLPYHLISIALFSHVKIDMIWKYSDCC